MKVRLLPRSLLALGLLALGLGTGGACEDDPVPAPPTAVEKADAQALALYKAAPAPSAPSAPSATSTPPAAAAPPTGTPAPAAPASADPPVQITFRWFQIAALYQGFLAQPVVTNSLGRALRGVTHSPVSLVVSYDTVAVRGAVRLKLTQDTLINPVHIDGNTIQLQDLAPVMMALAAYRKDLGMRFDLRLLNFRVGIDATASTVGCIFAPINEPATDGRIVSPCVDINGNPACGVPGPNGVTFDAAAADGITACLTRPVVRAD